MYSNLIVSILLTILLCIEALYISEVALHIFIIMLAAYGLMQNLEQNSNRSIGKNNAVIFILPITAIICTSIIQATEIQNPLKIAALLAIGFTISSLLLWKNHLQDKFHKIPSIQPLLPNTYRRKVNFINPISSSKQDLKEVSVLEEALTLQKLSIPTIICDENQEIIYSNHSVTHCLHTSRKKLQNKPFYDLMSKSDAELISSLIQKIGERKNKPTFQVEVKLNSAKNGKQVLVMLYVILSYKEQKPYRYFLQFINIESIKNKQYNNARTAYYNPLTELPNQHLLREKLSHYVQKCIRNRRVCALLYLNLDNFKRINGTLNYYEGNQLLKKVSTRLRNLLRKEDIISHISGDEFAILLTEIKKSSDASIVARKIIKSLKVPFLINQAHLTISTGIGISIFNQDANNTSQLIKNAQLSMYQSKKNGKCGYEFFSKQINEEAKQKLTTEIELRRGLENDEFELYFQPKIELKNNHIAGLECLIRWNHPQKGLTSPAYFIDVAESTDIINDLGAWVIKEACRCIKILQKENRNKSICVSVNVSAKQFENPNFAKNVIKIAKKSKIHPNQLELEITETMILSDIENTQKMLYELKEAGFQISIDDFGTGYSSLVYLKKLPIDIIKIDQSFIQEIPNNKEDISITSAVILMAHTLNMKVVAEGVETEQQKNFLYKHKCEYGQGYLFSKPKPLSEALTWIETMSIPTEQKKAS